MEQGFIDIHSHILPGIDDGSKSWEQTEKMLQMQREQGVAHVIATPHFDMERIKFVIWLPRRTNMRRK